MGILTMGIKFMIGSLVIFVCLAWLPRNVSASPTAQATPHAATSASTSLYLPLVNTVTREPEPEGEVAARFWLPFQTADNQVVTLYGPAVAVDSQGGIHLAYQMGDEAGPGYTWCPGNCESNTGLAGWQKSILAATSAELNQDWPVIPWYNCSISTWTSGQRPWLALDPRNHAPRISYEAAHIVGGTDLDHPGIACPAKGDIFLARVTLLTP